MKREKGNRREWIKMLSIAICDDEIQITGKIENLVRQKFSGMESGYWMLL